MSPQVLREAARGGYFALMIHLGQHTIQARVGRAVVDFLLAVEASVSRGALAEIASLGVVGTTPAVEARPVGTSHGAELAVVAVETGGARALVGVVKVLQARKHNYVTTEVCYFDVLLFPNAPLVSPPPSRFTLLTVQLPPLRQGFPEHSLTWISQLAPANPGAQEQV